MKKIYILIAVAFLASGCQNFVNAIFNKNDENFFFVKNNGADLPVWVKGNLSSNTVILFLHGGPGDSSFVYTDLDSFKEIEKNFAIAYYEQRGSGNAQGTESIKNITISDFVKDTDKVIDVIRLKYNNPKIFLMGHSWGGGLGTAYLIDKAKQKKISGWIEIDGSHNEVLGSKLSREKVIAYASEKINSNTDALYWTDAINWYNENPIINFENWKPHRDYVEKANGYFYSKESEAEFNKYKEKYISDNIFSTSPMNLLTYALNADNMMKCFDYSKIDFTKDMSNITIPSLIIWGKYDLALPVELADSAFDSLGTEDSQKYKIIFDKSGHRVMWEEQTKFANSIIDFIKKYN